mmetsp:Transcript_119634/g.333877  ORF Transcript_119634/g.333877 Transcript_119634/m.333877 type:complete len:251 (+) Transcript_119634:294-1046(+)
MSARGGRTLTAPSTSQASHRPGRPVGRLAGRVIGSWPKKLAKFTTSARGAELCAAGGPRDHLPSSTELSMWRSMWPSLLAEAPASQKKGKCSSVGGCKRSSEGKAIPHMPCNSSRNSNEIWVPTQVPAVRVPWKAKATSQVPLGPYGRHLRTGSRQSVKSSGEKLPARRCAAAESCREAINRSSSSSSGSAADTAGRKVQPQSERRPGRKGKRTEGMPISAMAPGAAAASSVVSSTSSSSGRASSHGTSA